MAKHIHKGISINKRSDGKFAFEIAGNSIRRIVEIGTLAQLKESIDKRFEDGATADCGRLTYSKKEN